MSEKIYSKMIKNAISLFNRCLEAKSNKNKISLGKKAIDSLQKSLKIAIKHKMKKKLSIIYEYITQLNTIIAVANYELKKNSQSILYFQEALNANSNTSNNSTKKERKAYISSEIAKLYSQNDQMKVAKSYALQSISSAKEINDEDLLEIYIELNPIFIKALDIDAVIINYKKMIKLAKRTKKKKTKAQVYFDYARFLFTVKKDYFLAKEYLRKTKTLYSVLKMQKGVKIVESYYDSKFDSEGAPILKNKED